MEDLRVIYIR